MKFDNFDSPLEFCFSHYFTLLFCNFLHKVASTQPQKAACLQTTERKISILEKAVELNPDSEELLLCLLKSYGKRDSTETLLAWILNLLSSARSGVIGYIF